MKSRIAAVCALSAFLGFVAACGHMNGTGGPSPTTQPSSSLADYPNGISPAWLSQKQALWASAPNSQAILSPTLTGASYDNIGQPYNTMAVLDEELSMLEDTGARAITIDLGYDPWLSGDSATIAKDDAVINQIRSSGHLVVIKDASAERYRKFPLNWDQFANAWVQRVTTLAARYHPDYYTVIKEPPWYAPMIAGLSRSDLATPADRQIANLSTWTDLLSRLINAVKSVSPTTKVGIAVDANLYRGKPGDNLDLGLMKAATTMPGLDFIGFDIYTASAFDGTQQFLKQVGAGDKSVWINEAWSITDPTTSNPNQEQVDQQWAAVLMDFGREIGAQGISPFYTDFFASYSPRPTNISDLLNYYKGRTPVFRAFQAQEG
ncbi:MAG TPA: hypothetical protein VMU77_01310 [Acidimicrobiales bacterium]|nr:hypothetical protein [Acidimicrobiales bacterium]